MLMSNTSMSNAQTIILYKSDNIVHLDSTATWLMLEKADLSTKCCNSKRVAGKIHNITKDSISIAMVRMQSSFKDEGRSIWSDEKYTLENLPIHTMAKLDIRTIQEDYNRDFKKAMNYLGGALLLTGAATAIHSLIVESEDRTALLTSAGIQVGSSLLLLSIGRPKKKFIIHEDSWQFR